ncbi:hypothetical protein PR048_022962 [Dryococelus australis]|uniref:Uncharacterized protein n=1 Tax=Dryococelus australis TaxID=614101 RepID=A0ABQ9GSQ1_9NEOP|nr:hypothetical protein PR048_022962 [Dryococelus australis]
MEDEGRVRIHDAFPISYLNLDASECRPQETARKTNGKGWELISAREMRATMAEVSGPHSRETLEALRETTLEKEARNEKNLPNGEDVAHGEAMPACSTKNDKRHYLANAKGSTNKNLLGSPHTLDSLSSVELSSLPSEVQVGARHLVSCLHSLLAQWDVREDIYSLGPFSGLLAAQLEALPAAATRRRTAGKRCSLILVDRTLDLATSTSHDSETVLDHILAVLPRLPGHTNDVAVNMSPLCSAQSYGRSRVFRRLKSLQTGGGLASSSVAEPGASAGAGKNIVENAVIPPGCLSHPEEQCLEVRRAKIGLHMCNCMFDAVYGVLEWLVTRRQKDVLVGLHQCLTAVAPTGRDEAPGSKLASRVTPMSLEKQVASFRSHPDKIAQCSGLLQQTLAVTQTLRSARLAELSGIVSTEKLLLQNLTAGRDGSAVLAQPVVFPQVTQLVRTRRDRGFVLEDLLCVLVRAFSLAGSDVTFPKQVMTDLQLVLEQALFEDRDELCGRLSQIGDVRFSSEMHKCSRRIDVVKKPWKTFLQPPEMASPPWPVTSRQACLRSRRFNLSLPPTSRAIRNERLSSTPDNTPPCWEAMKSSTGRYTKLAGRRGHESSPVCKDSLSLLRLPQLGQGSLLSARTLSSPRPATLCTIHSADCEDCSLQQHANGSPQPYQLAVRTATPSPRQTYSMTPVPFTQDNFTDYVLASCLLATLIVRRVELPGRESTSICFTLGFDCPRSRWYPTTKRSTAITNPSMTSRAQNVSHLRHVNCNPKINRDVSRNVAAKIMDKLKSAANVRKDFVKYRNLFRYNGNREPAENTSLLQQLVTDLLDPDRPELCDLSCKSGSLKDLIKTGFRDGSMHRPIRPSTLAASEHYSPISKVYVALTNATSVNTNMWLQPLQPKSCFTRQTVDQQTPIRKITKSPQDRSTPLPSDITAAEPRAEEVNLSSAFAQGNKKYTMPPTTEDNQLLCREAYNPHTPGRATKMKFGLYKEPLKCSCQSSSARRPQ